MPLKNGDRFREAVCGLKIYKFRKDIEDSQTAILERQERVKGSLRYAMLLVGIKAQNMPDDKEKEVLVEFIINKYGQHTPEEIKLAFDMAVAGDLSVDAIAYENFSPAYFAKIMNAYRSWVESEHRKGAAGNVKKEDPKKELPAGPVDWSDTWQGILDSVGSVALYRLFIPTAVFDWLERTGKYTPSGKEKWQAMSLAAKEYEGQMKTAMLNGMPGGITTPEIKRRLDILDKGTTDQVMSDHQLRESITSLAKQQMVRDFAIKTISNK